MFAGPRTLVSTLGERSNPQSPYYQSWVGGYVIRRQDRTVPDDLQSWAWQVSTLDQRSWLSIMGDPKPLAESDSATNPGEITIDGCKLPLRHGIARSHSHRSDHPTGPLATLIGMPPTHLARRRRFVSRRHPGGLFCMFGLAGAPCLGRHLRRLR
jgi:hypothetical protein